MFSPVLSIEIGVITAWSGAIGNIPPGWFLCDGTNGTPDLRDKFLVSDGPNFSVGDEGGNANHIHPFTGDGHSHVALSGSGIDFFTGFDGTSSTDPATGTTDPTSNLPTYYALAYIQYQGT